MIGKIATIEDIIIEFIKITPDILWVILSFIIFIYSYHLLKSYILPNLKNLTAFGVTIELLSKNIDAIIEVAEKNKEWSVHVSKESKNNIINRTKEHLEILKNNSILWFDDRPNTINSEIKMFNQIGIDVEIVSSIDDALKNQEQKNMTY